MYIYKFAFGNAMLNLNIDTSYFSHAVKYTYNLFWDFNRYEFFLKCLILDVWRICMYLSHLWGTSPNFSHLWQIRAKSSQVWQIRSNVKFKWICRRKHVTNRYRQRSREPKCKIHHLTRILLLLAKLHTETIKVGKFRSTPFSGSKVTNGTFH